MNSGVNYSSSTKGGVTAYWYRRLVHVGMIIIPLIYYRFAGDVATAFNLVPWQLVVGILILLIILEAARLYFRITLFGQRDHEAAHISSFFWGLFSIGLVLILAPPAFSIPIIWSCALVDPLLGEMRRLAWRKVYIIFIALIAFLAVWWSATALLGTPWWYAIIMAPLTLAAEWPNLKWIDDNALMQLIPLMVVLLVNIL